MTDDTLLLRPDEVARRLNLSRSKVYGMLKRGELPCTRLGRSVRVPVDQLERWLTASPAHAGSDTEEIDLEKVLKESGLWQLPKGTKLRDIAPCLVRAARSLRGANPLIVHVAREELLHRLTTAGVRSPARVLALAFQDRA